MSAEFSVCRLVWLRQREIRRPDAPARSLKQSGRQAGHYQAGLMALAIGFSLVMLRVEVDRHREFRLTFQHLRRMRGGRNTVAHLRESGGEKSMMSVVRPGDPGESFSSFGVFLRAI